VKYLFDHLSQGTSLLHSLDARAKIAAAIVFTVAVVSAPNHNVGQLFFFFPWPAGMLAAARLPVAPFLRRALLLSPLIAMVVLLNPFFEEGTVVASPFGFGVTAEGLLTSAGIAVKFLACLLAMLILVATTPFPSLISGIRGLGVPAFLAQQVSFIYRYLFILLAQVRSMKRARDSRSCGGLRIARDVRSGAGILGVLFMRTLQRGEGVDLAMRMRGFNGAFPGMTAVCFGLPEVIFLLLSFGVTGFGCWIAHGGISV
jgi:cobalt/nickel transport system permease protein